MTLTIIDTSVIQRLETYSEAIFEGYMERTTALELAGESGEMEVLQLGALSGIMIANVTENIPFAIPEFTLLEISRIPELAKRIVQVNWFLNLYKWWESYKESMGLENSPTPMDIEHIISDNNLLSLKDKGDRILVAEAIYYCCDSILHMDYKTIGKKKQVLQKAGITPYTPIQYCKSYGYIARNFL